MQVLKVTLAVLILLLCVFFSLRFLGLSQNYLAYDHPLMKRPLPWIIAWGGDQEAGPSHSRAAFRAAAQEEGVILAANIQISAENHFFVLPPASTYSHEPSWRKSSHVSTTSASTPTASGGSLGSVNSLNKTPISNLSDAQVKALSMGDGAPPFLLEEFLESYGDRPLLLWVSDNRENVDLRLEPLLKKYQPRSTLMIQSEFDNVVKSLKKLMPEMLYGTGVGQRVRALMLSSLWLEPMATIDGDFVIAPLKVRGVKAISAGLKSEILRRQKLFILGPLDDATANDQALQFEASGYLTSFPRDLKKKLNLKKSPL